MFKVHYHLAAGLLLLSCINSAHATVIYSQPGFPPPGICACWTSDTTTGSDGFQVFDNFTLGTSADITGFGWEASILDYLDGANNPVDLDTVSWELSFWSDSAGLPDLKLFSETLSAAEVTTTLLGQGTFFDAALGDPSINYYELFFDLSAPFAASAGTTYWVSILSTSPSENLITLWNRGSGGDGVAGQRLSLIHI